MSTRTLLPAVLTLLLLTSCAKEIALTQGQNECVPITQLGLNHKQMAVVKAALLTRIDQRRMTYNSNRFCAYRASTVTGNAQMLKIFQPNISHVSQTWILLTNRRAIDTKLNEYHMVSDSASTNRLIKSSVHALVDVDQATRDELQRMLIQEARFYQKRGVLLGTQKPPSK